MAEDKSVPAPETNKNNEKDAKIRAAFDNAVKAGKDEDGVKMEMVKAGCAFKSVAKTYNDYMVAAGFVASKDERDKILEATLKGKNLADEAVFNAAVKAVSEKLKGTNEKASAAAIRAWARKNEIECYKKPKGEGGGRSGFAAKFYDFLIANPGISKEKAKAFINGTGDFDETSENTKRHESHYLNIHALVNKVYQNATAKKAA